MEMEKPGTGTNSLLSFFYNNRKSIEEDLFKNEYPTETI